MAGAGLASAIARPPGSAVAAENSLAGLSEAEVPVRAITRGPGHHWFGYYDKLEFDASDRYVLTNRVDFEHRSPTARDVIQVGMVDLERGDRWTRLGQSRAWGWQQGCMLQWVPGAGRRVIWNDREGDRFVSRLLDVDSGSLRTLPMPIYALTPDGLGAVTTDFARLNDLRPGYGYAGVAEAFADQRSPEGSGLWAMDLVTGATRLIFSLAQAAALPFRGQPLPPRWHWFNHLLVSPDGRRMTFLHRWREQRRGEAGFNPNGGFTTRMITLNLDGGEPWVLDPSGATSHFIWRDPEHLCAWTQPIGRKPGFYLLRDRTHEVQAVGEQAMTQNGHNTYLPLPGSHWVLNDTYPAGVKRQQTPYLYHVPTGRRHDLGRFHSPKEYAGEWRCDTHPRSSRSGTMVAIDSPHGGEGRQVWLLDIKGIVGV